MDRKLLFQNWVRSKEDEKEHQKEDEMIFRPESYDFPLQREGREAIDLRDDKTFVQRNPSANDSYNRTEGSWDIEGNDSLSFDQQNILGKKAQIISLTHDKLIVKSSNT